MQKRFESTALIRFPDCDPFNHLNNSRYLDYFHNAREDHVRVYQAFDLYSYVRETGYGWVVGENRIAYVRPAYLMETVALQSGILVLGTKHIHVEMTMWNEAKTELKALLWSQFVHVNVRTGKTEVHAEVLTHRFKDLEIGLPQYTSFEQRLIEYRGGFILEDEVN